MIIVLFELTLNWQKDFLEIDRSIRPIAQNVTIISTNKKNKHNFVGSTSSSTFATRIEHACACFRMYRRRQGVLVESFRK